MHFKIDSRRLCPFCCLFFFSFRSAFAEIVPSLLRYAIDKEWRFSEGLRDQGLFNDFFRAYSNSPGPHRWANNKLVLPPLLVS